jgi:hypothetical protein
MSGVGMHDVLEHSQRGRQVDVVREHPALLPPSQIAQGEIERLRHGFVCWVALGRHCIQVQTKDNDMVCCSSRRRRTGNPTNEPSGSGGGGSYRARGC